MLTNTRIYMVPLVAGQRTALTSPYRVDTLMQTTLTAENFISSLRQAMPRKRIAYFCTFCRARSVTHRTYAAVARSWPQNTLLLALISLRYSVGSSFLPNWMHMYRVRCDANMCHFSVANTFIFLRMFSLFFFFSHWKNIECPTRRNRIKFKR